MSLHSFVKSEVRSHHKKREKDIVIEDFYMIKIGGLYLGIIGPSTNQSATQKHCPSQGKLIVSWQCRHRWSERTLSDFCLVGVFSHTFFLFPFSPFSSPHGLISALFPFAVKPAVHSSFFISLWHLFCLCFPMPACAYSLRPRSLCSFLL